MEPEIETSKDESLKQIRTFEGDIADAVKSQKESIVSIQRAEHARAPEAEADAPSKIRAVLYSFLALILIGMGAIGFNYAYQKYKAATAPPVVVVPANQIIPAQKVTNIDASILGRLELVGVLNNQRTKSTAGASFTQVELRRGNLPSSEPLTTADFLTRINSHAPAVLVRALDPIFELLYWDSPAHGALVIKLLSFENTFPAMLNWEAGLPTDLGPVFTSGTPTGVWQDETIDNRDVRALKDTNGQTSLLYGYYGNNTLIIVGNEEDFRLIVDRLSTQELSR